MEAHQLSVLQYPSGRNADSALISQPKGELALPPRILKGSIRFHLKLLAGGSALHLENDAQGFARIRFAKLYVTIKANIDRYLRVPDRAHTQDDPLDEIDPFLALYR